MKSNPPSFRHRLSMLLTGALLSALSLPASVLAQQTDPGGGIGGTGITGFGVVQKFGSIFVNGREFFFDKTTHVSREGVATGQETLRLGDVVLVQGDTGKNPGAGTLAQVDVRVALQGRVQDINEARGTFRLLGQTVQVGSGTRGDSGAMPFSLSRMRMGEMLAVSGLMRADSTWMATRITPVPTATASEFIVRGSVDVVDRAKGTITLGKQSFVIEPKGINADIEHGAVVRIAGVYDHERVVVTSIQHASQLTLDAGQRVEMSGYVQTLSKVGEIKANDVSLHYNPSTTVVSGHIGDLQANTPVAVRGEVNADGSITVHEMVLNVDPSEVVLPEREGLTRPFGLGEQHAGPEKERPEAERPVTDRLEVEKPEVEKPQIEIPEIERPELPTIEQ